MKVQYECTSSMTEDAMKNVQGMGIEYLAVNFLSQDTGFAQVMAFQKKAAQYHLKIADAGCPALQKCPSIHLGRSDRDQWIGRYNEFTKVLGEAGIGVNYLAWQPNGIFRSGVTVGGHTRGQYAMNCDLKEILSRDIANDRVYGEAEIWENFQYFIEKALPVCEQMDVKLALHPNDPPVMQLGGVHSLIYRTEDYHRAFAAAGDSPYLGMKLCVGCWLEQEKFGDLMQDIETFTRSHKVLVVHFRNVSSPLPYFEETLPEDGYGDMYAILERLQQCGYDGQINIDHPFFTEDGRRSEVSEAYFIGYMKGMLSTVRRMAQR